MNISIVIPVYNEAAHLGACLRAIAVQNSQPFEVIVVDNNSDDNSVEIASRFSFVTVVHQPRQGVVHARNIGFNHARGDVIGRIDADTILPANWTEKVEALFCNSKIAAVSGAPDYYDFALNEIANNIDHGFRKYLARKLGNNNFLWGANMAIRRSAWLSIRSKLCSKIGMHEDFDLGIHLQAHGFEVAYEPELVAGTSFRRVDTGLLSYVRYSLVSPRTYAMHDLSSRRYMYPVLITCWLVYLPARIVYRGYNPETGLFSLTQLLTLSRSRVDPTSNII